MTFSSGLSGLKSDSPASRATRNGQYAPPLADRNAQFVAAGQAGLTDTVNRAIAAVDRLDRHCRAIRKRGPGFFAVGADRTLINKWFAGRQVVRVAAGCVRYASQSCTMTTNDLEIARSLRSVRSG